MGCFNLYIIPDRTFHDAARDIGKVFDIPLEQHVSHGYDEFPAYKIDWEKQNCFITLLGIPENIDALIHNYPFIRYTEIHRQYELTICAHNGVPCQTEDGFSLPYQTGEELGWDIIRKLQDAGFHIYTKRWPRWMDREMNKMRIKRFKWKVK